MMTFNRFVWHTFFAANLLFCCWLSLFAQTAASSSQQFEWETPVPKVENSGFHQIQLSPQVVGRMSPYGSNLRLKNDAQQEVPYLLEISKNEIERQEFEAYTVVKNDHIDKKYTELIIENSEKQAIETLTLQIANVAAKKWVRISGSTDQTTWFLVKDKHPLTLRKQANTTIQTETLRFPRSEYPFYKLEISDSPKPKTTTTDWKDVPINILEIGNFNTDQEKGAEYDLIPIETWTQKDSSNTQSTYLTLRFDQDYYLDKLEFEVAAPELFQRQAKIVETSLQTRKQKGLKKLHSKTKLIQRTIQQFSLSTDQNNEVLLNRYQPKKQTLTVVVKNENNPPLQISSIKVYQVKQHLIAELQADRNYTLKIGHKGMPTPQYDLGYFQDEIPEQLPVLQTNTPQQVGNPSSTSNGKEDLNDLMKNPAFAWTGIAAVTMLLIIMTLRMMREMKAKG